MNTNDNLFIRACKTLDPETRIKSLYRRIYNSGDKNFEALNKVQHLRAILGRICEDYNLLSMMNLLHRYEEKERMDMLMNSEGMYYFNDTIVDILINAIALSRVSELPGSYRPGGKWSKHDYWE